MSIAFVAKWLRRWTHIPTTYFCVGSNPARDKLFFFVLVFFHITFISFFYHQVYWSLHLLSLLSIGGFSSSGYLYKYKMKMHLCQEFQLCNLILDTSNYNLHSVLFLNL